jgi:hypothetical protein
MAEYAITQGNDHKPAFNWWVPQVLRLHKCIISLVKKQKMSYLKKNMKFGIEVPTLVDHALKFDRRNGNTLWADIISKEMNDIRIALTLAALNDLKVKAADIMNAYISTLIKEKVWCALGPELFGSDAAKSAIIVHTLYGLKSAGAAFHAHLADCMWHLGYTFCPTNPDLWYKEVK